MLLENYLVGRVAKQLYPFLELTKKEKISKSLLASIKKDVGALTVYQLNSAVIHGTDNIIITALEGDGVQKVGLYANYTLISETANTILGIITGVLTPSIGNLNVEEDNKKKESIFYTIMFVCAWAYGYACTGILSLSEKFITQWLGAEFVFGSAIVFAIVLQLYVRGVHYAAFSYRVTCGLFVQSKFVPVFTSLINIGLSIYWGKLWGIFGILLASSVARVLTTGISDPVLVYKHIFKKSPIAYYSHYFLYAGIVVLCYFVSDFVTRYITIGGWLGFILSFVVYSIIFNGIFALCTFKTQAFEYLKNVFLSYFKKFLGKLAHR
jgi:O-antigen/teichoic acid export membrane protein